MPYRKRILSVEDDPADIHLISETFGKIRSDISISFVKDGLAATDYLLQRGIYSSAERPDLILLDLNLPKRSGFEVLELIKKDRTLRSIPVIILTTSSRDKDIQLSYELQANCYLNKPVDLVEFEDTLAAVDRLWLRTARLPGQILRTIPSPSIIATI